MTSPVTVSREASAPLRAMRKDAPIVYQVNDRAGETVNGATSFAETVADPKVRDGNVGGPEDPRTRVSRREGGVAVTRIASRQAPQ
jgi:hypothetical protein